MGERDLTKFEPAPELSEPPIRDIIGLKIQMGRRSVKGDRVTAYVTDTGHTTTLQRDE